MPTTLELNERDVKAMERIAKTLNFICYLVGMIGVWYFTKSVPAMVLATVASLHFRFTKK